MTSSKTEPISKPTTTLEASTLKKGLLWQQRDKFFSRWKERYFVLTRDYLACFKKEAKVGVSEMGSFLYKINLVDIEGLQWTDKKRENVIAVGLGNEGQLLLWNPTELGDWMFTLQEATGLSKGRREILRKSQSLLPQITDRKLTRSQLQILKHNLNDDVTSSSVHYRNRSSKQGENENVRPTSERQSTPHLRKRDQRMSVTTDIDLYNDIGADVSALYRTVFSPRLAPQCSSGSLSSLVSYVRSPEARSHLEKVSPRSLHMSPALSEHSLYAQHILSTSEISTNDTKLRKIGSATANSEFSYIRSNIPVSSLSTKESIGRLCQTSDVSETTDCEGSVSWSTKVLAQLERLHILNPPGENVRPSSIYGQPSLTSEASVFSTIPPDVVPTVLNGHPQLKQPYKRFTRPYQHTKSDTSFNFGS
ncbi:uncharacterized protein LOC143249639 [Tachypleus tridentatus]|uniref:uncharacterized protein LOC143249639 n=1 Tax=Tachypleus tridentatus TaxID=6853 RepID=UPI003FD59A4A